MSTKEWTVFGSAMRFIVDGETTEGAFLVMASTVAPGGGPPPHRHVHEDEFFYPIEGEFEIFDGTHWNRLTETGCFAPKGAIHTYRNCGDAPGTIMEVTSPVHIEGYFEKIDTLQMPQDHERLAAISADYGITFV